MLSRINLLLVCHFQLRCTASKAPVAPVQALPSSTGRIYQLRLVRFASPPGPFAVFVNASSRRHLHHRYHYHLAFDRNGSKQSGESMFSLSKTKTKGKFTHFGECEKVRYAKTICSLV